VRKSLVGFAIGVACLLGWTASSIQAKGYPDRPVRIVVANPPGGVTDVLARIFAQKLSESLAARFYVENLPGAAGDIGTGKAAAAPTDGSTILFTSPDFLTVPLLKAKTSYDPMGSFVPVTLAATAPGLISVNASLPARSMSELFQLLKVNPGKYSYATPGFGSLPHLEGERQLRMLRGLNVVHVPFQGFGPAITSTIAGHTPILWGGSIAIIAPHVQEGKLRTLMISSSRRSPKLPDAPTKEEAGLPDYSSGFWGGVMVPAATPKEIVTFLHQQIVRVMLQPDVKQRLDALGFDPVGSTPDEFAAWLKHEYAKYGEVVRQANFIFE